MLQPLQKVDFLTPGGKSWRCGRSNALRYSHRLLRTAGIPKVDESGRKVRVRRTHGGSPS